jgi:hypothetical protein
MVWRKYATLPNPKQSVPRRRAYTSTELKENGHEADALRAVPWASPLEHYASAGKVQVWSCVCSEQSAQQQCCLPRRRQHIPERAQNTGACVRGSFVRLRHCQATTQCLTAVLRLRRPQNFALVDEQVVRFTPGLNVITGASGSGKSVLVRVCRPCAVDSSTLRVDLSLQRQLDTLSLSGRRWTLSRSSAAPLCWTTTSDRQQTARRWRCV